MIRRLVAALILFAAASFNAQALEYTDVYFNPDEPGWGLFLVQSETFQFVAFFIYGPDGKPIWYTAELSFDGTDTYAGTLYATTGTYFASPWDPSKSTADAAGTASFKPIDLYHATLSYGLIGGPTVTKTIRRQTLLPYQMAGNYSGSTAGAITGCNDGTGNDPNVRGRYNLVVTQVGDESVAMTVTFVDQANAGIVCTLGGSLTHLGRLYRVADGLLKCSDDDASRPTVIESLHPTGQGIEFRVVSDLGGGCKLNGRFSAVK
jgi:hypothetical protein